MQILFQRGIMTRIRYLSDHKARPLKRVSVCSFEISLLIEALHVTSVETPLFRNFRIVLPIVGMQPIFDVSSIETQDACN